MLNTGDIEISINKLVKAVALHYSVRAIGMSGGERPFPEPGEGDIDLFVYCTEIPGKGQRLDTLAALKDGFEQIHIGRVESGHWGQGDSLYVAGIETWLLYFACRGPSRIGSSAGRAIFGTIGQLLLSHRPLRHVERDAGVL